MERILQDGLKMELQLPLPREGLWEATVPTQQQNWRCVLELRGPLLTWHCLPKVILPWVFPTREERPP